MKIKDIEYKALKAIETNKNLTQRELAKSLDISLGKTNFIMKAFVTRGWIKLDNFRKSNNKIGYAYILTPKGILEKTKLAWKFLNYKQNEYEILKEESGPIRSIAKSAEKNPLNEENMEITLKKKL